MVSDETLIKKILKNDAAAFNELKTRHFGLYLSVSKKFLPRLNKINISLEDLLDDFSYVLFIAVRSYDGRKSKFSTWFGNYTRYHCLNILNRTPYTTQPFKLNEDGEIIYPSDRVTKVDSGLNHYFCNLLKQFNDRRIEKIYELRYFSGKKMPWRTIAEKMNISIQAALNLHNRAKNLLKQKYLSKERMDLI